MEDPINWFWKTLNNNKRIKLEGKFTIKDLDELYELYINIHRKTWLLKYYDRYHLQATFLKWALFNKNISFCSNEQIFLLNETGTQKEYSKSVERYIYEILYNRCIDNIGF